MCERMRMCVNILLSLSLSLSPPLSASTSSHKFATNFPGMLWFSQIPLQCYARGTEKHMYFNLDMISKQLCISKQSSNNIFRNVIEIVFNSSAALSASSLPILRVFS